METLRTELGQRSYDITIHRGAVNSIGQLFSLRRRVLILTDSGVPEEFVRKISEVCGSPRVIRLEPGEANKCPEKYFEILKAMTEEGFDRHDCLVSAGGGVIGDLGGFAAATYMRGIDFYNVPTTLLSQIDSSIGGKVAIDFEGYKNLVGTFYQPKGVLIDPDVLGTLDPRQYSCGMAEAIKMFATSDEEMFRRLEKETTLLPVDQIILKALEIKKGIVEQDEGENGLRKILNFGHTVGHGIESISSGELYPLLHGECVGIGMLCMCSGQTRERIARLLHRFDIPTSYRANGIQLAEAIRHDKKSEADTVTVVRLPEIGHPVLEKMSVQDIIRQSKEVLSLS